MKFQLEQTLRGKSDDELLQELRSAAARAGRETITLAEYEVFGVGHASTFQRRFGSWPKALKLAGLKPSRSKIGISEYELFDNIKKMWLKLGRQPRYVEVKAPDSQYSAGTYENRFASWRNALNEFVEWANCGEDAEDHSGAESTKPTPEQKESKRRSRREISDRQRFRILLRDGFRCKACGTSPISSPGTELQVDHVIPWSKGGETIDQNLQTKCSRCNLGKGNAFEA